MKPIQIITFGVFAFVCGAAGTLFTHALNQDATPPAPAAPAPTTIEYVATETDDGTTLEIAQLRSAVDSLRDEVSRLSTSRESAVETEATPAAAVTANAPSRDMILNVMQQEEDRKEEERRLEREQREADALNRRIERIAEKLSLSSADQATLTQIYTEERAKQSAMWTEMRDGGMDRDMIREGMTEVREWRTEQLNLSFGEDLAGQIAEESGGRGWGDWGGGRGNNDGGGRGGRGGGRGN